MSRTAQITPYSLRIEPDLRKHLEQRAKESGRSLHAEIIAYLKSASEYQTDEDQEMETKVRQIALEVVQTELDRRLGSQQ